MLTGAMISSQAASTFASIALKLGGQSQRMKS